MKRDRTYLTSEMTPSEKTCVRQGAKIECAVSRTEAFVTVFVGESDAVNCYQTRPKLVFYSRGILRKRSRRMVGLTSIMSGLRSAKSSSAMKLPPTLVTRLTI